MLTLWGGRERSSSDSGVRAGRPGDPSLSSCPVLVLLALDKKSELQGRSQRGMNTQWKKDKGGTMRVGKCWFLCESINNFVAVGKKSKLREGGGDTEGRQGDYDGMKCVFSD